MDGTETIDSTREQVKSRGRLKKTEKDEGKKRVNTKNKGKNCVTAGKHFVFMTKRRNESIWAIPC